MRVIYVVIICFFLFLPCSFASSYHLPVEKYNLSNGLTVILEEDHSSNLVAIQLWVRTGSCYEDKFMGSGITHLVEHMVFKGEKSASSMRIAKELQRLGGELDASTSKEYTEFNITIGKDNLERTLELLYSVVTKAEFNEEELEKEKEVVIREMDTIEDDPHKLLVNRFFKLSFQGHPYGEPVIGERGLFQKITREDIEGYYKTRYIPRNMILAVAGDFESSNLESIIGRLWGQIPDVFSSPDYIPGGPSVKGPTKGVIPKDISSGYIVIGFYGPSIESQDVYPMDILAEIAGGSQRSRLVKRIRDKLGLVSDIGAWSYTPTVTGIWGVSADLAVDDWGLVLKDIIKEVYRFRLGLVTEKELSMAKKQIAREYLSSLETIDGRASDLGSNEIYTRNPLFSSTYIRGIRNVTAEDVRKAARKYFDLGNLTTTILTPKIGKKPISKIEEEKEIVKIDNGVRVLIKEDHRIPLATIRLAALGGLLEEDIPGLSYFFSQLWLKENQDLVERIESVGGSISTYSGNNSLGCSIEVFKEDIGLALDVVEKLIQGFTPSKMELVRNLQLAEIRQEEDSPYGFAFRSARNIFFGGHPYRNSILGTSESVAKIREEDIRGFFNRCFTPENIVISVFGDIDIQTVQSFALNNRGAYVRGPASDISPKVNPLKIPEEFSGVNEKVIFRQTEQAIIILAYPGVSIYSEDRYAMELLTQVFSGQAGRLYETIREKEALSYSVGALSIIGREPGSFMFYIATQPDRVDEAKEFLFNEVSRIKAEGITEEELERVKKYFVTQTQRAWESTSGLSLEVTLDELYGLGWDYHKKYLEEIDKVTIADIKNVANKYFRDDWYSLVIVGKVDN